ncbi:MAG TPA: Wzz/FepE/Etk N-terminal domain-containing protein [Gaiellaceae bacterium]|nr:Wzz/FepE/Etk N-terminal domain-containing protein [Gaiellaceae bacterium]
MSDRDSSEGRVGSGSAGEQPIEVHRHLDALRRARWFILAFVAAVTVTAVVVSLLLPDRYRATATIVLEESLSPFGSTDVETVQRRLETIQQLLGTNEVLDGAAEQVPGETRDSLEDSVSSSVDNSSNIISISAEADEPEKAAAIANAVAQTFLESQEAGERERLAEARRRLEQELNRLRSSGARPEEIEAVRQRISELTVSEVSAGSELELAQAAEPPDEPFSPRPIRNGLLAFFASLFLAVLIALGRDLLVPRAGSARELSRLLNLPVLAGVPYVARRFNQRRTNMLTAVANEAYQTLQASVRYELPPDRQRVILVSSALEGEGKTHVSAGLGRALARVGHRTLVVCADLRFPTLHEQFGLARAPGLSDILQGIGQNGAHPDDAIAEALKSPVHVYGPAGDNLKILTSGTRPQDPSALMFGTALDRFFGAVAKLDYSYVIVDGPPLLGIADAHALAQRVDGILVVSRLDRSTLEDAIEMSDLLYRLDARALGLVVVGVRRSGGYAYAGAGAGESGSSPPPATRVTRSS